MPHDEWAELSKLRLENARVLLDSARLLMEAGDYKSVANRSYYAIFAAMRACLAPTGIDHKKHSGVISDFRLHFIKTGKLREELSDIVSELFDVRTQSDYNDFYIISKAEISKQLENAELFVREIEAFLKKAV
jgi:uncharacterized protein (UPF0332 family)